LQLLCCAGARQSPKYRPHPRITMLHSTVINQLINWLGNCTFNASLHDQINENFLLVAATIFRLLLISYSWAAFHRATATMLKRSTHFDWARRASYKINQQRCTQSPTGRAGLQGYGRSIDGGNLDVTFKLKRSFHNLQCIDSRKHLLSSSQTTIVYKVLLRSLIDIGSMQRVFVD
jgi:hypothetical protein